jgi:hypothetical protein
MQLGHFLVEGLQFNMSLWLKERRGMFEVLEFSLYIFAEEGEFLLLSWLEGTL